jgi:hypothetical protein
MIETIYQLVKDILGASETDRRAQLSNAQWERTLAELDRQQQRRVQAVNRAGDERRGRITHDFIDRGCYNSGLREQAETQAEVDKIDEINNSNAEFQYLKDMIELERQKLGIA